MRPLLERIFFHWKTSTAGIALTLGIVYGVYKPGMSWKQWALAVVPAVIGALLRDPGKN